MEQEVERRPGLFKRAAVLFALVTTALTLTLGFVASPAGAIDSDGKCESADVATGKICAGMQVGQYAPFDSSRAVNVGWQVIGAQVDAVLDNVLPIIGTLVGLAVIGMVWMKIRGLRFF